MDKLPKECITGVTHVCFTQESTIGMYADFTCTLSGSSDSVIYGSFCPKYTDTYTFYPKGTLNNPEHYHSFKFDDDVYESYDPITRFLYAERCHYYEVYSGELETSSVSLEVSSTKHGRYLINGTESLTCNYRKCANGGNVLNRCIVYDKTCKDIRYKLKTLIASALYILILSK